MCGRFASARKRQELLAEFQVERDRTGEDDLAPDYNVAPTKPVYAVVTRARRPSGGEEGTTEPARGPARELRVVRWGLVPSWAKDTSIGSKLINARVETVDAKPAFRRAFAKRRCLLPADGFFEWLPVEVAGRTRKQPYYIHRADGGVLAFAGLYELWRDKSRPDDDPDAWLWTAVVITTEAKDEAGRIHDRMPMVIDPSAWQEWLDPAMTDSGALHDLLVPAFSGGLTSHPVSTDVNNVRNNGPRLIEPAPPITADPPGGKAVAADGPGRRKEPADPAAPLELF